MRLQLRTGGKFISIDACTQVFPRDLDPTVPQDFTPPLAGLRQNPNNPQLWRLQNLSPDKLIFTPTDGLPIDVDEGRSTSLADGNTIVFCGVKGRIIGDIFGCVGKASLARGELQISNISRLLGEMLTREHPPS
jgi:hypothetical protein